MIARTRAIAVMSRAATSFRLVVVVAATAAASLVVFSLPGVSAAEGPAEGPAERADIDDTVERPLPSISARHVRFHEASGRRLMDATIDLSPDGLRVRQRIGAASLEMIQDFNLGKAWLVDGDRRIAHELPEGVVTEPDMLEHGAVTGTFLGQTPCALGTPLHSANGKWRGRRVAIYHCLDDDSSVSAIEFLDAEFGLIAYRKSAAGFVDELRNLKFRKHAEEKFSPPSHFRSVDKRELFHGAPALGVFKDSKSD